MPARRPDPKPRRTWWQWLGLVMLVGLFIGLPASLWVGWWYDVDWMFLGGLYVCLAIAAVGLLATAVRKVLEVRRWESADEPPEALQQLLFLPLICIAIAVIFGTMVVTNAWGGGRLSLAASGALVLALFGAWALWGRWFEGLWREAWSDWCRGRKVRSLMKYSAQVVGVCCMMGDMMFRVVVLRQDPDDAKPRR